MIKKLKFSQYAEFLAPLTVKKNILNDFDVFSVVSNSSKAAADSLFCAVKGVNADGNEYISDALQKGAGGLISALKYENVNSLQVVDDRLAYSEAQRFFYNEPDRNLQLIGITGTNGKTTGVYILFSLLSELGAAAAMFTTVENFDGVDFNESDCTTPEAGKFFEFCRRSADNGAEFLAMECSSHALSQKRLGCCRFQAAIFTNLTGDHLDYHLNMDNYFAAKKILFERNLAPDGTAVINIDDIWGRKLAQELKNASYRVTTFGFDRSADLIMSCTDHTFRLNGKNVESSLFGTHNFYNITGVLGALSALGFDLDRCLEVLKRKKISVPGRLEMVDLGVHGKAFVDYAHTDDALKNVLTILKMAAVKQRGRVICVFGCGGNRDKTKRPRMGRVVSELADIFILTSDNPRDEEPEDILKEISAGCLREPFAIEADRAEAIAAAVEIASANDIILVAGKGHEKTQEIKGEKLFFDDKKELEKYIQGDGI